MFDHFFDISQLLSEQMPVYPGDPPFSKEQWLSIAQGDLCNLQRLSMGTHCGTHLDAPLHFIATGKDIAEITLEHFFGKARVLELKGVGPIRAEDLEPFAIKAGEQILLKILVNQGDNVNPENYTALTPGAADFLVQRAVRLVGINCASIEHEPGEDDGVHTKLLGAGILILENVVLDAVEPGEYWLACFPMKLAGGDGSPVRAVLMQGDVTFCAPKK